MCLCSSLLVFNCHLPWWFLWNLQRHPGKATTTWTWLSWRLMCPQCHLLSQARAWSPHHKSPNLSVPLFAPLTGSFFMVELGSRVALAPKLWPWYPRWFRRLYRPHSCTHHECLGVLFPFLLLAHLQTHWSHSSPFWHVWPLTRKRTLTTFRVWPEFRVVAVWHPWGFNFKPFSQLGSLVRPTWSAMRKKCPPVR